VSAPPAIALPVLFRDAALAVVDKPAGLAVEADSRDSVLALLARQLAPPGGRAWPRVVHRLDRETSGCLAVALNKRAEEGMARLFDEGGVQKRYLAIALGAPPDEAALDTPYGQDPRDRRRFTTRVATARRARLTFRVRERLKNAALLEVALETGRTHQIRVQLAEAGFPVLGDSVYAKASLLIARVALHAERLQLAHPIDGQPIDCTAPLPADFIAALSQLKSA
jgi:23S rRNA pseudouridine1911/1915/1917 synthase